VRGAAGTGKTTLEDELRLAWSESGVPAASIAQSTTAVEELREQAGFGNAATIASFLRSEKQQSSIRGGVLLVDEASLVGTRDMLRLFDIVREQDARIVLVGDRRQHRSVSAGEPLRLLEQRAGIRAAEVTGIVRQQGDYRKATTAASEGKTALAFAELDRLGWIREIPHAGRYWVLAQAYLSAVLETKKNGERKTALVVSPTHAEGARITKFIRDALKADGRLGQLQEKKKNGEQKTVLVPEQVLDTWIPARLTDPEKTDATNYEPGDMVQFHDHAPGIKSGSRLVVGEGEKPPVKYAGRFEVYRPAHLALTVKDRVRVTVNGWTKDRKHKLPNGSLFTVEGFTKQGDLIVDKGWVIAKDFGHLAHGYVVTSHASEGKTVDKVFIGESSQSFPATNQRSFYVPVTRGREQAVIFTDDKKELLRAVQRRDEPMSATELAESRRMPMRQRLRRHMADVRRLAAFARNHPAPGRTPERERQQEMTHGR
jgi:hypothetical protein